MKIMIKYLPKDEVLYELWLCAKTSPKLKYCEDLPVADLQTIRDDINYMIENNRSIKLTVYYGRMIYTDITPDEVDFSDYIAHNRNLTFIKKINTLKLHQLARMINN